VAAAQPEKFAYLHVPSGTFICWVGPNRGELQLKPLQRDVRSISSHHS
jgi:hypothetical protein